VQTYPTKFATTVATFWDWTSLLSIQVY